MIDKKSLEYLQKNRNLLAFSGGGDSTALLFLLLEHHIDFDIAIVDYGMREEAHKEVAYAQRLAQKYDFRCFTCKAPKITNNFEANARAFRYDFFASLIHKHRFGTLLTAHHLGDRLEWFLMQLGKGAGVYELLGMQSIEERENFTLVRPLLHVSKSRLLAYLHTHNIPYFEDSSNNDTTIQRNFIRHEIAQKLLERYENGIRRSFSYLEEESTFTMPQVFHINELSYAKRSKMRLDDIRIADKILKSRDFLMRRGDKELLKSHDAIVAGRRFAVAFSDNYILIAPYIKRVMEKSFKESCRKRKIPEKLRGYCSLDAEAFASLSYLEL